MLYGYESDGKRKTPTILRCLQRKTVRFEGKVYTYGDLVLHLLDSGYVPYAQEGVVTYYGSRWNPKESQPKTEYYLRNEAESLVCQIRKTEYDFARYLIANGFDNPAKREQYRSDCENKLQLELQAQAEIEKARQLEQDRRDAENADFEAWLTVEAEKYVEERDYRLSTLERLYRQYAGVYGLFAVKNLVLIDNYDVDACKKRLLGILSVTTNKASRKTFERCTGARLPDSKKETILFLNALTKDLFKRSTM